MTGLANYKKAVLAEVKAQKRKFASVSEVSELMNPDAWKLIMWN
jgi:hypothetical protein